MQGPRLTVPRIFSHFPVPNAAGTSSKESMSLNGARIVNFPHSQLQREGGSSFSAGSATRLFEHPGLRPGTTCASCGVSAGRQRSILAESVGADADAPESAIRVVLNWREAARGLCRRSGCWREEKPRSAAKEDQPRA